MRTSLISWTMARREAELDSHRLLTCSFWSHSRFGRKTCCWRFIIWGISIYEFPFE